MSKTLVLLGAGTGLGPAIARRFGGEGFRIALVARNRGRLAALVDQLAAEGIEAAAFPADLARPAEIPVLVDGIRDRFERIDVVAYAPLDLNGFTPAADLTPVVMQQLLDLYFLTPIALVQAVLGELRDRGEGSILISQSVSATQPAPVLSGIGPAMAATRNYIQSLSAEISPHGVHAATLQIGAMIRGSAVHSALLSGALEPNTEFPEIDPADIAETLWEMHAKRDASDLQLP
ncbi:SDR family NAD(P)-dependent oxidoreductase [Amycolatopsis sp. La24]|uniref:SDR family NAD(P)-dependent oxidoreductase n=1 Tax=Amycolatopsis sp. La24 TaxID=3028304 RepID=UPI0023AF8C48|nr:SDR family NAD(P)-dependent oxidoreductase [Amycolatopsis sp. La24]